MEERISAPHVARLVGIKTHTLAKWRCLGKGPQGWIQVSPTHVTYRRSESKVPRGARRANSRSRVTAEVRR